MTVAPPSVEDTVSILRGLKDRFERYHNVHIQDAALVSAAVLSDRYVQDRFLPDKAIDLLDEACASIRTEMDSMPAELDEVTRKVTRLQIEETALKKEKDHASQVRLEELRKELAELKAQREKVKAEKDRLAKIEKAIESNEKRMKERIKEAMETMGKSEIKTDLHTFKIQNNGGLQPLMITGDVPDKFTKIIIEPDNEKIREALTSGQELDFAHLEPRGTQLRIR